MKTLAFYKILPLFYKKLSIVIYKKLNSLKWHFIKKLNFWEEYTPLLRPSLLLSSLMEVLPGKDGDWNGVSTKFLGYRSFTRCATPTL